TTTLRRTPPPTSTISSSRSSMLSSARLQVSPRQTSCRNPPPSKRRRRCRACGSRRPNDEARSAGSRAGDRERGGHRQRRHVSGGPVGAGELAERSGTEPARPDQCANPDLVAPGNPTSLVLPAAL